MTRPREDQQALLLHARAAHQAHRYDVAYDALRSARALGPVDPHDLHLLADAAWWLGLLPECLRLTEQAHRDFLTTGHLDRAAAQALDMGGMLALRGEPALASGWLNRARRLLEGLPVGPSHGILWYVDASIALEEGRPEDAQRISSALMELGGRHSSDDLVALGHLGIGRAVLRDGRVAEAFDHFDEAMLLVLGGVVDPEWSGHICCSVVASSLAVADLNRARHWSEAAYRYLANFDHAAMFTGVCRAHDVDLLVVEGEWSAAQEKAALVTRDLAELNVEAVAEADYQCGECHRVRGELEAAAECYARAAALGRDPQPGAGLLALARGEAERAWVEVTDAASRSTTDPFQCARLLRAVVEVGLATGRLDEAESAARQLREAARTFGTAGFVAWADQCDGTLALARGDAAVAVDCLDRAAAAYRRMRAWYDAAVADLRLADAHQVLGAPDTATVHRGSAISVLRRLGTPVPAAMPRPVQQVGGGGLTPREAEVLAEVATGASNRAVAMTLSISEATVRRHLANIFAKLGVGSRTAAAAWAHQEGLRPTSAPTGAGPH